MKYRIEFQTNNGTGATEIEAPNEQFARAAFYEIYNRRIKILTVLEMHRSAA